jgi:hypothetical protein
MIAERIQTVIHKLDVAGVRWVNYAALTLVVLGLGVWYDTHCYQNYNSPEAMDMAQVARNVALGRGFTTEYIRPFSVYLLQQHHRGGALTPAGTNQVADPGQVYSRHPDLANAPLYPLLLAGLFKATNPDWNLDLKDSFWSDSGRFLRYKPEFMVAIFNQLLLLVVVLLSFLIARLILDGPAAWLVAVIMLFSDELWRFSISGLPTMLLLVIFLGVTWCMVSFEALSRAGNPDQRRQFMLAGLAGLLIGLGLLTRYSFGWMILPVGAFLAMTGGARRSGLVLTALLVLGATAAPWVLRNYLVSGTLFGTAGYALMENSYMFPGTTLMQSLKPQTYAAFVHIGYLILLKLKLELPGLVQDGLLRLGGSWMAILFLSGLLLRLRHDTARRLRYFTMFCLGTFLIIGSLGRTPISVLAVDLNTENLLVLLTPLVVVFGVAFFLTLLNQMLLPSLNARYCVVGLVALLACQPMIMTLLPPRSGPTAFPPYFPPDMQRFSRWIQPDELMMSDIPWAVAWYSDRQCVMLTINSQYEYSQFDDYVKHVSALYLTRDTLDGKLLSDCLSGGLDTWSSFVFERIAVDKIKQQASDSWGKVVFNADPNVVRSAFPLKCAPAGLMSFTLLLADRQRW